MLNRLYKNSGLYLILAITAALLWAIPVMAASDIIDPETGYTADDILSSMDCDGGFDIYDGDVYYWNDSSGLVQQPLAGGSSTSLGSPGNYSGTKWNSFVRVDSNGTYAWVGFTVSGNTDDRIYRVTISSSTWVKKSVFACNYDLQLSGANVYVAGKNSTDWNDPHAIWLLDTSAPYSHTKLFEIDGYSACFAIDSSGRFYAGTYPDTGDPGELYRWAATSPYSDTLLSSLPDGGNGITIDASGDVFVNVNNSTSSNCKVLKWNGTTGSGNNYTEVGHGQASGSWGNWFGFMKATGTVDNGGKLYLSDYYFDGLAEIQD